jgi:C_GCAxxG_C_C family probable redox protein
MNEEKNALAFFKEGFSCSQAVVSTYGEQFGLDRDLALKISSAFGGGMGGMGEICGAVTGALMVIGLRHGRTHAKDKKAKKKTNGLVKEFSARFISLNGSIRCKDLLGVDMSTPEGAKLFKKKKLASSICPKFIHDSIRIINEIT